MYEYLLNSAYDMDELSDSEKAQAMYDKFVNEHCHPQLIIMKLQNTNTKVFKARMFKYLLDSAYDMDELSDSDKAQAMYDKFVNEYCYPNNMKLYPNTQDRLKQYLLGLPFDIDYSKYDILRATEALHELPDRCIDDDSRKAEELVENWFNFCAFKFLQMWEHYNVVSKHNA